MSKTISRALAVLVEAGTGWMQPYRRRMTRTLVAEQLTPPLDIAVGDEMLRFHCPTGRSLHDPGHHSFTDEPETLRWIDSLPESDTYGTSAPISASSPSMPPKLAR